MRFSHVRPGSYPAVPTIARVELSSTGQQRLSWRTEESRGSDGRVGSSYTAQGIRDSSRAAATHSGMTESGGKVKDNRPNIVKLLAGHYTSILLP